MITITRKIELFFNCEKEQLKAHRENWWRYQKICHKAANIIATHHFVQTNIIDFHYIEDETKKKLANIEKDADGILNMSKANTTYSLLSKHFKGDCPMGMLSGLNQLVSQSYTKESLDVKNGIKSLRSYKRNIPLPIRTGDTSNLTKLEDGNYSFFVYGTPFVTRFGRDLSGNRIIFDSMVLGKYKWCDSSIVIDGAKMFLLAVFQFDKKLVQLDSNKIAECVLGFETPMIVQNLKTPYNIGNKEEFLHGRLAIQGGLHRLQKGLKYAKGGKGRENKLQAIEQFKKKEYNYIKTKLHTYSRLLIDFCIKSKISKIKLINYKEVEEQAHANKEFLLRNWNYYGLSEMIKYKANKFNILVEIV